MNWIRNMNVNKKMAFILAVSLVCVAAVGGVGYFYLEEMEQMSLDMYENNLIPIDLMGDIRVHNQRIESMVWEYIANEDSIQREGIKIEIDKSAGRVNELLDQYLTTELDEFESRIMANVILLLQTYRDERQVILELVEENNVVEASVAFTEARGKIMELNEYLNQLSNFNSQLAESTQTGQQEKMATAVLIMLGIAVVGLAIIIGLSNMISKMITRPIQQLLILMDKVNKGDLTVQGSVESCDELGKISIAFNNMIMNLGETVEAINHQAEVIAASSQEISASTEEIANGTQDQAENATAASVMMKELSSVSRNVAENITKISESSEETVVLADNGGIVIRETVRDMEAILSQINNLSVQSQEIGQIVEVIDEIAEQTNLLALNAAIEAARAGEYGSGFAVVADEVRKLAERSSQSTKNIAQLVRSIQDSTGTVVEAVKKGNHKTEVAGTSFDEIITTIKSLSNSINEIAALSEEQYAQTTDTMKYIENIASVIEETAAGSEETAATSVELAKSADHLNKIAAKFKTNNRVGE